MVEMLQKIRIGDDSSSKKGFVEGSNKLWLSVVNAKIHNLIKESEEQNTIAKKQKAILKFVKKEITPLRESLVAQMITESVLERKLKLEVEAKRALAVEKFILSLTLTLCLPGVDMRDLTETYEQIQDLMECFKQLGLGRVESANHKKKVKKETSGSDSRKKAFSVLFDLLFAQLIKSQSFVREMANYVFKQFCSELDAKSLEHLLEMVTKPMGDGDMLEADSDFDDESDSDKDAELMASADSDNEQEDSNE